AAFERAVSARLPESFAAEIAAYKARVAAAAPTVATRQASGETLDALVGVVPELLGGSADLTGSNNTRAKGQAPVKASSFAGGYIHYGVREHAMAAMMNGIALHRGLIPYGGTFLVFSDYLRPSLRLAALMGQRVIHVLTHDSIGLGEDGPTHQPVEHLAALRAIPNLLVFRPADAVETVECWDIALRNVDGPSALALTRQALPTLRRNADAENLSARGGYVLAAADGSPRVTLIATGSEVTIALAARTLLQKDDIPTAVVSMPSTTLFDRQPEVYRRAVLGPDTVRVAVEAAVGFGWDRYIGADGAFVGMAGFGASAPYLDLYQEFGITAEHVAAAARACLARRAGS
ncbi:MAG: transketolase family protein, partial [Alphaproteobacteria bacterium]|nr:transketolase family protein [Alphaproteobacteria bacterium]